MVNAIVERLAWRAKAEVGKALNADALLGNAASGDWFADAGRSIDLISVVQACLAEAEAAGWRLVPVEPTDKMKIAWALVAVNANSNAPWDDWWKPMLDAAPKVVP